MRIRSPSQVGAIDRGPARSISRASEHDVSRRRGPGRPPRSGIREAARLARERDLLRRPPTRSTCTAPRLVVVPARYRHTAGGDARRDALHRLATWRRRSSSTCARNAATRPGSGSGVVPAAARGDRFSRSAPRSGAARPLPSPAPRSPRRGRGDRGRPASDRRFRARSGAGRRPRPCLARPRQRRPGDREVDAAADGSARDEQPGKVALVTGEESAAQVKLRADRLGGAGGIEILAETNLDLVCATLERERPTSA